MNFKHKSWLKLLEKIIYFDEVQTETSNSVEYTVCFKLIDNSSNKLLYDSPNKFNELLAKRGISFEGTFKLIPRAKWSITFYPWKSCLANKQASSRHPCSDAWTI